MNAAAPLNPVAAAFEQHRPALQRYLRSRLSTPEDANDLTQEVFLQALLLEHAERVRDPGAFLIGIAFNVLATFGRKVRTGRIVYSSKVFELHEDQLVDSSAEDLADTLTFEHRLVSALVDLPPLYLKIILHELRDGLSQAQIAARYGLHEDSVRQYSARAMGKLRRKLELPVPGVRQ